MLAVDKFLVKVSDMLNRKLEQVQERSLEQLPSVKKLTERVRQCGRYSQEQQLKMVEGLAKSE